MIQMDQWHFWYADDQEIIYINYNLLKDEKIRFPQVIAETKGFMKCRPVHKSV